VPVAAAVGGDGAGAAAEARFWAAVDGGDVAGVAGALAVDERAGLDQVLPRLAQWRRRERAESVTAGWRYRVAWVPVADPGRPVLAGRWLVVVPSRGCLPAGVVAALAAAGAEVVVLEAGPEADRAVLAAAVAGLAGGAAPVPGLAGVVSLLALAEGPLAAYPVVPSGLAGTLALVQGLGDAGVQAPLWMLTRGAVAAGAGEPVTSPVQAMAWGLGLAAALEYPDRWGGLIDLPPVVDRRAGSWLCAMLAGRTEEQLAVRAAGVFARRLVRTPRPRRGRDWRPAERGPGGQGGRRGTPG
jgi:hypothetical protein